MLTVQNSIWKELYPQLLFFIFINYFPLIARIIKRGSRKVRRAVPGVSDPHAPA